MLQVKSCTAGREEDITSAAEEDASNMVEDGMMTSSPNAALLTRKHN
jgi:hypothetical protein